MQQIKKPQETLNKENKDVILEKPTNCLRKIFLNDINIKENEKQKCFQKSENKEVYDTELKNPSQIDSKVLGDHSYSERLDDTTPNRKETSLNNIPDNASGEENVSNKQFIKLCNCEKYLNITLIYVLNFTNIYIFSDCIDGCWY